MDYEDFLKYQKQKSKIQRQVSRLFRETLSAVSDTMNNFFMNQVEVIYDKTWQFIQHPALRHTHGWLCEDIHFV